MFFGGMVAGPEPAEKCMPQEQWSDGVLFLPVGSPAGSGCRKGPIVRNFYDS